MKRTTDGLIAQLANELQPVRPLRWRAGMALALAAFAMAALAVVAVRGLGEGVAHGHVSAFFVVANGLLLLLGLAGASAVIAMASPNVGAQHQGPKWALAMVMVLPVAAAFALLGSGSADHSIGGLHALYCIALSLATAALVAAALVVWLRRGAPVSAPAAGLYTGIAAGALGSVAYGLSCPVDTIAHLGIAHVVPVALAGAMGRIALPAFLRW